MVQEFNIKRINKTDIKYFQQLIHLFEEVFENEKRHNPPTTYLKSLLSNKGFVVFVAINDDEVIGGLTAFELPIYYYRGSEMFIYDIAIKPDYQRKGIGKKLLTGLKDYCRENNISEIFVAANEKDTHALKFYCSAGGIAEKVVHFNFNAK